MSDAAPGAHRPRLSLRAVVFALVAGPGFAFAAAVFLIGDAAARSATEKMGDTVMRRATERTATRLDALLGQAERVRFYFETRIAAQRDEVGELDGWAEPMRAVLEAFPDLASVAWASDEGHTLYVLHLPTGYEFGKQQVGGTLGEYRFDPGRPIPSEPLRSIEYSALIRPWYLAAGDDGSAGWSDVYTWIGSDGVSDTQISVSNARRTQRPLPGVASVDVSLNTLSAYLASMQLAESGLVLLSDHQNLLIASSDGRVIASNGDRRAIDAALREAGVRYTDDSPPEIGKAMPVRFAGERARMIVERYQRPGAKVWTIHAVLPESAFLGPVRESRRRALWLVVGAGMAIVLITLLVGRAVSARMEGVLSFVRRVGEGDFEARVPQARPSEWRDLTANLNAMAIDLRKFMTTREALSVAHEVQHSLLPERVPDVPGLDVHAHCQMCDETGGDFYDFRLGQGDDAGTLVIALGDVTGHGVAAALLMATARAALRAAAASHVSVGENLTRLNQQLSRDARHHRFVTMVLAEIDPRARRVTWASAGHDPSILYDPRRDEFTELTGCGVPLAVLDAEQYTSYERTDIAPGAILFLGTDGIWEATDSEDVMFGKDRLRNVIRANARASSEQIGQAIERAVRQHRGDAPQTDDVTYIIVRFDETTDHD